MTYDKAAELEEQRWEAAESRLHEEVNRLSKEHRSEIEAAQAQERIERMERKRARIRRENRDLFLCRISLCMMIATMFVTFGVAHFIALPFAGVGVALATVCFIREVRCYVSFVRRWSK